MNNTIQEALSAYIESRENLNTRYLITTESREKFSANAVAVFFKRPYGSIGFVGCSSDSGRRTMITKAARKASQVAASLRDVMDLAGHKNLQTTQV